MELTERAIFSRFFLDEKCGAPYRDAKEQLRDCVYLADMYLSCAILLREQGLILPGVMPGAEKADAVMRSDYLENRASRFSPAVREDLQHAWQILHARTAATDALSQTPLSGLCERFLPDRFSRLCLFLALAYALDKKYAAAFSLLQNDTRAVPCAELAWGLYLCGEQDADPALPQSICWSNYPARLLFEYAAEKTEAGNPLVLRRGVLQELLETAPAMSGHEEFAELITPEETQVLFDAVRIASFCGMAQDACGAGHPAAFFLWGARGSGRFFWVRHFAATNDKILLKIEVPRLLRLAPAKLSEFFWEMASLCAINGCIPVLFDADFSEECTSLLERLMQIFGESNVSCVMILSEQPYTLRCPAYYAVMRYQIVPPSPKERVALWKSAAQGYDFADVDFTFLANQYHLSPGQIRDIVRTAALSEKPLCAASVSRAIATHNQGIARRCVKLEPIFKLEDLILDGEGKRRIQNVINRIRFSYQVNVDWDFDRKFAYGRGVSVLLYGSPGTGKTMCAHVLASELGLELYKANLSGLVSKYVGETEKNLEEVFTEAQKSNAILFFDEADALFSKRSTESGGANDKYANMETSYLLQKMEEHSGITILATNLAGNFDKAFYRRIQYMIHIAFPDESTRAVLWQNAFPAACPLAADVDYRMLSRIENSPSTIKSVALEAAYRAAAEACGAVGMRHIVSAMRDEYAKQGKTLSKQESMGFELYCSSPAKQS